MLPVAHPKPAVCDVFFFFFFFFLNFILSIEKQQCTIFLSTEQEEIHSKRWHLSRASPFWCLFCKKDELKYLIYHINMTDVFIMFRSKNYFVHGACFFWYLCFPPTIFRTHTHIIKKQKLRTNSAAKMQSTHATGNISLCFCLA